MKLLLIILYTMFFSKVLFAQLETETFADLLKTYLEENEEDENQLEFIEYYEDLKDNPLDINTATKSDLEEISILSQEDINNILTYRNKNEKLFSVNELKFIVEEKIFLLLKFLLIVEKEIYTKKKYSITFENSLKKTIQDRVGFIDSSYIGNSFHTKNRIKLNYNKQLSASFIVEKDPGEKDYNDFSSFTISLKDYSFINRFVIGSYQIQFGEGLNLWSAYSLSKGVDPITPVASRTRGIIPSAGSNEYYYFNGVAASANYNNINFGVYYSQKNLDATISDDEVITSFKIDGYHKTENDLSKIDVLKERFIGGSLSWNMFESFTTSLLATRFNYDKQIEVDEIKQTKNEFTFLSFANSFRFNEFLLMGESSYNEKSFAHKYSVIFYPEKHLTLSASIRSYPINYYSIKANAFSEKSGTKNETGIYFGVKYKSPFGKFAFYFDQFSNPQFSNNFPFSAKGNEISVYYENKISNSVFYTRLFAESKEILLNNESNSFSDQKRYKFRTGIKIKISSNMFSHLRIEKSFYETDSLKEGGFLLSADLKYFFHKKTYLITRVSLYNTDSYNTRIYQYENDITGSFTNLPFYLNGFRWYAVFNTVIYGLKLQLKYSETYKPYETSLSSGKNEITGNSESKISIFLGLNI